MRADNDSAEMDIEGFREAGEDAQEDSMGWLLDMDRSEPEEKLFALDQEEYQEDGLSESEAELAARPLTSGGGRGADDLSMFVEEEIVVSSEGTNNSIFTDRGARPDSSGSNGGKAIGEVKAIDHSRMNKATAKAVDASVEDGSDILGLAEDDDMGETFLTIKRVKVKGTKKAAKSKNTSDPEVVVQEQAPVEASQEEVTQDQVPQESVEQEPLAPPRVGESVVPAAVAEQEADLSQESAVEDELNDGWLEHEALKLGEIEPSLESDVEDLSATAIDMSEEFDADDFELADVGATLVEQEKTEPESNDWLGDVDLELVDTEAVADEGQDAQVTAEAEDVDWLDGLELELVDQESVGDNEESGELVQIETQLETTQSTEAVASGDIKELAEELEIAEIAEADEWLGSSDLELYEMTGDITENTAENTGGDMDLLSTQEDDFEVAAEADEVLQPEAETDADAVIVSEVAGTGLVAEPGEHTVANEEPASFDVAASSDEVAQEQDDVLGYVSQHKAPLGDEEFDEYLMRGAHLAASTPDLDNLEVERTEGIVSVDPGTDVDIDYHDDFRALEGFNSASLSAITSVISDVMEDISAQARVRMSQLGMAADAIEVDVMLGSDADAIKQCRSEGYDQVGAICTEIPAALAELGQAEVEAIYVRLFNGQTNENHNDLFSIEVTEGAGQADTQEIEDLHEEQPEWLAETEIDREPEQDEDALAVLDVAADETVDAIFGDDVFGEDFLVDDSMIEASGDIDLMFDELVDGDEATAPVEEFALPEQPEEDGLEELDAAEVEQPETLAEETAGFDEDIFSTEFSADMEEMSEGEAADIDTVFAGLDVADSDSGEICGLDVDEFEDAEDDEVLEAVTEYAEAGSAQQSRDESDMSWCIPQGIAFDHSGQGSNEIFADFLDAFIEEGSATVEKLEDAIGDWERDISDEAAFVPVTRILHTLKGIAKGVGLQRYGTLIHNFETLLEGVARPEADAEQEYFRIVNAWLDAAVRGLEFVQEHRVDVGSEFPAQNNDLAVADTSTVAEEPVPGVETATEDSLVVDAVSDKITARQKKRDQQLADEGAKALAAQQSVRITSEKLDHLLNLTNQAQQLGVRSAQSSNRSKRASAEMQGRLSSVRTHIARIADRALLNVNARGGQQATSEMDALEMDQYSELQEAANILREAVEDLSDLVDVSSRHNAVLEAQLKQQATVISTISSSIQAARVVPVSRLMPGLRRIVRTVSTDLDKSVAFKVLNETGALDRDYYARCQVILEHMVRNALDHGIESPEERLAVGKATTGRITIDVRKSGADYYITLTDDGRGIDPYEMRESAFRKGLDLDVDALSDDEAIQLIFHKGFSTAAEVSEISGRGVGMDIVLSELQQIGGDIKVQSTVGLGTTFEVHVPANVTVNGALFVTVSDNSYAIPLNGLVAVDHVPVADYFNAVERGNSLTLSDLECEPAYLATLCHGQPLPDRDVWGDTMPVIIAGSDKRYMAIAVDNVEEALELVIRSLGPQFANVPGVAGGATTADGEAIVALDLNMLVDSVATGKMSAVAVNESKDQTMLALVVDDSRTQRMVTTSQFDTVGVETITAENGLVAIDLLNTTHRLPDVVLLDVEMPVKDGIETLREIRKSIRYKHLPVIMVTSRTGAKHRALAEEAGCDGYMGKPFNFPGLIEQINELTGYDLQVS